MAKSTPPSGVLKVAAMPAPAPAATRVIRCQAIRPVTKLMVEPNDAPICAIGPSRPTDAPLPMARAEASDFVAATIGRM